MKNILLFISFFCITSSYAQFGNVAFISSVADASIKFTGGMEKRGVLRNNAPFVDTKKDEPILFKFKEDGASEYSTISSTDVISVTIYDKKTKKIDRIMSPIRVRDVSMGYKLKEKYFIEFQALRNVGGINIATTHLIYTRGNASKFMGNIYYVQVPGQDYYVQFDNLENNLGGMRGHAKNIALILSDCKKFQEYIQTSYIDSKDGKAAYKEEVKTFSKDKKSIIQEYKNKGYSKGEAKFNYLSDENDILLRFFINRYNELCGSQEKE